MYDQNSVSTVFPSKFARFLTVPVPVSILQLFRVWDGKIIGTGVNFTLTWRTSDLKRVAVWGKWLFAKYAPCRPKKNTYAQAFENQMYPAGMKTFQKSCTKTMRCKKGGVPSKLARTWETTCLSNWEVLYGVTFPGILNQKWRANTTNF